MKIGELAKQTGMAASAIRFYEARGLLSKVRRGANGYRDYPPETVPLLTIIGQAQQAGFSLDEIKQLVPADISSWQHAPLLAALEAKVSDIHSAGGKTCPQQAAIAGPDPAGGVQTRRDAV
ncbi:MerR family transcriptional regulator [Aeromonas hydrophila]|uniref:MerR family transcriptional regulator n=1 Tax=Aeromonas hydrophila TaxID=644 RepID=UPI003F7A7F80